ncbi:MAG TPA: methyltransferase [Streptosporangiaceae bacterium]|nr:methyltransferase [Streptosporangiaceae bacterium]
MTAALRVDVEAATEAGDAAITALMELADYVVPFAVRVACDLGLADLLSEAPCTAADLAEATGAHPQSLTRLLRALAARGIFTEVAPQTFGLTPLAEPLRSDHPLSLRAAYPLLPADIRTLGRLTSSIRTGEAAFQALYRQDYWSYLADHPRESLAVDGWMASLNSVHLRTVLPAYDWGSARTVADLGGGNGAFLAGLLARYPGLRGILLDLPHVVAQAGEVLAAAGVAQRCQVVPGSFFDPLPTGADLYVLKTVLPGWATEEAVAILRNVRAAMPPDARLVLLEALIPDGNSFDVAKLVDVHTLALTGGRHRSHTELPALLGQAGLELLRWVTTPTLTLVEAGPCPADRRLR